MQKFLIRIFLLSTFYFLLFTNLSFAEEKAPPAKPVVPLKELTKEEKIEVMNNNLFIYGDEISAKIPQLVKEIDKENIIYKFKKESGEVVDIKDLDEETLSKLYGRITNEAVLIRTERLNRQLQQIRQQVRPPQIPKPPQPAVRPPQPPRVYTPPRVPSPPPSPPQQRR